MNTKNNGKKTTFKTDNIHPIKMTLLEGQAEIVLRALELYAYNLEYMLNLKDFKLESEEISRKQAMLKYTYETIASYCAEARSENCIYKNLKILKNKNLISRIGANKNGYWKIRDNIMDNVRDNEINFDEIIKNII